MIGNRIKELRKEKRFSQAELAEKIETDEHMISRYENNRVVPSAEVIIKIAQVFDVSTDYILLENAPKKLFKLDTPEMTKRLQEIESLNERDKDSLFNILDALLMKSKFRNMAKEIN